MNESEGHGFIVVEVEPTFDDAINDPAEIGKQYNEADQYESGHCANHRPQQTEPEGAYLPAEMAFQPGSCDIVLFHVVDDDADDGRNACEVRQRIQDVHNLGEVPQRFHLRLTGHDGLFVHIIPWTRNLSVSQCG